MSIFLAILLFYLGTKIYKILGISKKKRKKPYYYKKTL